MVKSVTPRPLFKLFTTYDSPWWRAVGVEIGRSTTDLPVRQTYYWPSDDGSPVTAGPAMLMTSYNDGLDVGFWDAFRPQRGCGWRTGMPPAPANVGVQSWQVSRDIIQPAPDVPVYICGEAYSTHQGWVEGALQTADMVLSRFGITPLANQQTP